MEQPGLLAVPSDALLHSLLSCSTRDLAAVAQTCRALRTLITEQDALWLHQCEQWVAAQVAAGHCSPSVTALQLRDALRLPSYRLLRQALHALGSWPLGLWCATSDSVLPRGRLLLGQLGPGGAGGLHLVLPRALVTAGPAPAADTWELLPTLSIAAEQTAAGTVSLGTHSTGLPTWLQLSQDGGELRVARSSGPGQPPPLPGHRTIRPGGDPGGEGASRTSGMAAALASLARHLGVDTTRLQLDAVQYRRVRLPPPAELQAVAGEPQGMALLRRCQGVFTGSYGPHGQEVLQLLVGASAGDVPPLCPITGPRLQACKLLGDPNVPALRFSFVADAGSCRLGPYDDSRDDPFAPIGGLARPCLAFYEGATTTIDLATRPVLALFRAVGQINVDPRDWQPQWVPATLVLYEAPLARRLTVVFEDPGEPFRHAIDLQEFPYVEQPALA